MDTSETERRRFTRIHFDASTEIKKDEQSWDVSLVDISFNGVMVKSEGPLPFAIGDHVEVIVHLLGNDVVIKTPATLTHLREHEFGFSIENLDLDSLTQIRRLIELNLGDESLLERELEHLFHPIEGH